MNIEDLTIKEARELAALFGGSGCNQDDSHWKVGDAYYVRTVTHHIVGKLEKVTPQELVFSSAAWVADSGRWSECMNTGDVSECEPWPDGIEPIVGRGALIDAGRWPHALLRVVK